jgi:hypothetical protein
MLRSDSYSSDFLQPREKILVIPLINKHPAPFDSTTHYMVQVTRNIDSCLPRHIEYPIFKTLSNVPWSPASCPSPLNFRIFKTLSNVPYSSPRQDFPHGVIGKLCGGAFGVGFRIHIAAVECLDLAPSPSRDSLSLSFLLTLHPCVLFHLLFRFYEAIAPEFLEAGYVSFNDTHESCAIYV